MASGAIRRGESSTGSGVHGIIGLLPGGQMALRVAAIGGSNRQTVVVVDMAEGASHICMSISQKEPGGAVVERRRRPTHRVVAGRAICNSKGRPGGWVDRIVGLLPGGQMALRVAAVGCGNRQAVVVVNVAQIAGHVGVTIGQREPGRAMIEDSCGPGCNRVASCASRCRRRETGRNVIRYRSPNRCGAGKSCLVAAITIGRIERIIVIHMAGSAWGRRRGHVCSGKGEPGDAVIERGRVPACRSMAICAIRRSKSGAGSGVDRGSCLLPLRQVALRIATSCRGDRQTVVVVDMAGGASNVGVALGEQESGGAMVECRRRPADRVVAGRAVRCSKGRAGGRVHGIVGLLPGGQMALRIAAVGRSDD